MNPIHPQAEQEAVSALLAGRLTDFCHGLRGRGFRIGVKETLDACRIAGRFMATDYPAFRDGLRSLLCASEEQWRAFGPCFDAFWSRGEQSPPSAPAPMLPDMAGDSAEERARQIAGRDGEAEEGDQEGTLTTGASAAQALRLTDLSLLSAADLRHLERLAERLWRRMSLRLARRLRGHYLASRIDLRRTLRRNISRGGELLELVHAGKKRRKPGLVLLLDVSGSMNQYSLFFLRFAHALQQHFRRVHSFLFSTHLVEVSEVLRGGDLSAALELLSHMSLGWGGGTQIGESLQKLNRDYGDSALRGRPYLIVLSDGWDVGETELLSAELQALRRRVSKIIWLNPLLGMEGYEPLTRGMRTALPWLNVFAPAHNLESLLDIERHLVG